MAREQAPAFQFYVDDWLSSSSVTMMTPEQRGCYIDLICHFWRSGTLPDDDQALAALARVPARRWIQLKAGVLRPCRLTPEGWVNDRVEAERVKQREFRDALSEHGRAGARARWNNCPGNARAVARPMPGHSPGNASSVSSLQSSVPRTAATPLSPVENPVENGHDAIPVERAPFGVLSAMVRAVLTEGRDWSYPGGEADLMDELKTRCAKARLGYDTESLRKALDSERVKALRRRTA